MKENDSERNENGLARIFSTTTVVFLTIICAAAAIIMAHRPEIKGLFVEAEIYRLTYQFFFIIVVGGFVSLAFRAYEQRQKSAADKRLRDEQDEKNKKDLEQSSRLIRRDLLKDFYSDLITSYNDAKKVRRVLRAKSKLIDRTRWVSMSDYEQNMLRLEDVQLKLEQHVKEIDANSHIIGEKYNANVKQNMKKMEKYLREITKRYEDRRWEKSPN